MNELSVADKLITIANNTPLVCEKLYTEKTVSGNPIVVDDVSSTEHNLELRVTSKNLITFPYLQSTKKLNGITVTANGDGSVSAIGTATADTTIYFDLCEKDFGTTNMYSGFIYAGEYAVKDCTYDARNKKTYVLISVKNGKEISETYYPQIEKNSRHTAYEPYLLELKGIEISKYGKNLFTNELITDSHGSIIEKLDDNNCVITADGTGQSCYQGFCLKVPNSQTFTLSLKYMVENTPVGSGDKNIIYVWKRTNDTADSQSILYGTIATNAADGISGAIKHTFEYSDFEGCPYMQISWYGNVAPLTDIPENPYKATLTNIQLEVGSDATEYAVYKKSQTATANSDGIVEAMTSIAPNMTLFADNGAIIECGYKSGGEPTANEKFIELQKTFSNVKEILKNNLC